MKRLYLFMGIQSTYNETFVCMCGNTYGVYGPALETECPSYTECGGRYGKNLRNAVYRVEPFNATYIGCHRDNANN